MRKIKRPKSVTLTLNKRIQILLEMGVAADKRTDYIISALAELLKNQPVQDDALSLIYETLTEMRLPWYAKLWRWIRCRERNTS